MQRHRIRFRFAHIFERVSIAYVQRIRFRRQRQIHRHLRQRQISLRRAQKIECIFRCQRHGQCSRLCNPNTPARHPYHSPRQIQGILSALQQPRQPIQRRIRIRIPHRFVQRRNQVVVFLASLVIPQHLSLQHILQKLRRDPLPTLSIGPSTPHAKFQRVIPRPRIPIRKRRNPPQHLICLFFGSLRTPCHVLCGLGVKSFLFFLLYCSLSRPNQNPLISQSPFYILQRPQQQFHDLWSRQRLQHIHLRPRKQRRNHFKRRILRGGPNEQNMSRLHMRQKRILLRLVEPVHLVDKHNRSLSSPRLPLGVRHHFLNFFDPA